MKWLLERMLACTSGAILGTILAAAGCDHVPSAHTISRNYGYGDALVDPPAECEGGKFDEVTRGGQLFKYYCGSCHNARALGERPFSNYQVAMAHMREQAYLTGKEYREIVHFLRRWHDVGPPTPDVEPSPKRFIYAQPISELRPESPKANVPEQATPERSASGENESPKDPEAPVTWNPQTTAPAGPKVP